MYLCYLRNIERANGSIDYMLLQIGLFGTYESTLSSDNHSMNDSDSDSDSIFPYIFSCTTKLLMTSTSSKKSRVKDYDSTYTKQRKVNIPFVKI